MIPKIHAKGSSFKGAAQYLLHDKDRAATSQRVVSAKTQNLFTTDPHTAWRVMAATALNAHRLKQQAGIPNTGRKSRDVVLHATLSWHPDEAAGLTKKEMLSAAHKATKALGAEDRQAIWVVHDDEPQPHIHLLINRVSPTDGRMLSSSKEKLRLSKFALDYERDRGKILCEERALNWQARDRGEFTRGKSDKPRHILELEAANSNKPGFDKTRIEQKTRDTALSKRSGQLRDRHARAMHAIDEQHRTKRAEIRSAAAKKAVRARDEVRSSFKDDWRGLMRRHESERTAFEANEKTTLGRVSNAFKALDLRAMLRGNRPGSALREAYNVFASSGSRARALISRQSGEVRKLESEQKAEERSAVRGVRAGMNKDLQHEGNRYLGERASVLLKHQLEMAGNRSEWRTRSKQRREAFDKVPGSTRDERSQDRAAEVRAMAARHRQRGKPGRGDEREHER